MTCECYCVCEVLLMDGPEMEGGICTYCINGDHQSYDISEEDYL